MDKELTIVRPTEPVTCENCGLRSDRKQFMIRRDVYLYNEPEFWHFKCALLNDIAIEATIVRLSRAYKGPTT